MPTCPHLHTCTYLHKVEKESIEKLKSNEKNLQQVVAALNSHCHAPTCYIHPYARLMDLAGKDDALHRPSVELVRFIAALPHCTITPKEVGQDPVDQVKSLNYEAFLHLQHEINNI